MKGSDFQALVCGGANIVHVKPIFGWDSKCLICCSGSVIKVLSVATGECIHHLKGHTQQVTGLLINPDNRFQLYSASTDKTIIKWDYQDGVKLKVFQTKFSLVALHRRPETSVLLAISHSSYERYDLVSFKLEHVNVDNKVKGSVIIPRVLERENSVSAGFGGEYAAAINGSCLTVYSFTDSRTKDCYLDHHDKLRAELTCVACHPTEACIATGSNNGKIILWNNVFSKRKVVKTPLHWHSLHVKDLAYTAEGSYLLSGGHECVLVKWQHKSHHQDFFPRLGSPIVKVTCSTDGTVYATCHADNSIQVIANNFIITQHYQGLTGAYLGQQLKQPVPAGLHIDPRTKALVTNGRPGHLQFYSLHRDIQLYNLDIVCQNYISPENLRRPLVCTELENVAFDQAGDWMATLERWDDGEMSMEMKLKFWKYSAETQRFLLNTSVDLPHSSKVHTLKFRPVNSTSSNDQPMAVTTSWDGKFKLWSLVDDSDIYRKNVRWNCESVGFYRDLVPGPADFSQDGSLLAVGFDQTLSLWDPNDNALRHTFRLEEEISHLEFGTGVSLASLMIATKTQLVSWNLLSCSVSWVIPLDVTVLIKSPVTEHIAVFTQNKDLFVFTPKDKEPVFHKSRISQHDITAAVFAPHEISQENNDPSMMWQNNCQLYFMNRNQELITLASKEEQTDTPKTPLKFAENLPKTPFSMLMSQKRTQKKSAEQQGNVIGPQNSTFLKEMLSTPAHVQPPMSSMCKTFMESLLLKKNSDNEESEDEEAYMESKGSQSDSDVDMDTTDHMQKQQTVHKGSESSTVIVTKDLQDLTLEEEKRIKQFNSIKKEQFKWIEKVL